MSEGTKLVGPAQFCRDTGFTKPTFYSCLRQMVEAGVAAKNQRKIDMNCQWMVDYLSRSKRAMVHRSEEMSDIEEPPQSYSRPSADTESVDTEDLPPINEIMHMKEAETLNKLRIDNAVKAKKVVSKRIVLAMIEKIDDALNKIIMDGEASFVPQLIQKVRAGNTEEEIKKFWRKEIGKIIHPVKPFLKRAMTEFLRDKK